MCLSRSAFLGEAVHRHGTEGSPRIRHQAEEGGEDEGDQGTGTFEMAVCAFLCKYASVLLLFITSCYNTGRYALLHLQFVWNKQKKRWVVTNITVVEV